MAITIIAEVGVNHNGSLDEALRMVDEAAAAGVDYVKFQSFKADRLVSPAAEVARYAKASDVKETHQMELLRKLELDQDSHKKIIKRCREKAVKFLSTGFDESMMAMLVNLGIDCIKIPSGELTNLPYLRVAAGFGLPVILSTGMASLDEVKASVQGLLDAGLKKENLTLLHCTTQYPTPYTAVNLLAMLTLKRELGCSVGYSDHSMGTEIPVAAAALGARVIEKHFTLDSNQDGPDHKASLEPDELRRMVAEVRNVEAALGTGEKCLQAAERENVPIARKSIHTRMELVAGTVLQEEHLVMLRPGDGISPMDIDEVLGQTLKGSLEEGAKLSWNDLE